MESFLKDKRDRYLMWVLLCPGVWLSAHPVHEGQRSVWTHIPGRSRHRLPVLAVPAGREWSLQRSHGYPADEKVNVNHFHVLFCSLEDLEGFCQCSWKYVCIFERWLALETSLIVYKYATEYFRLEIFPGQCEDRIIEEFR